MDSVKKYVENTF